MTRLILLRHGETAWNAERRLQGHLDIPLNASGQRQAAALGAALAGERIDAIISSDLQRAAATADAIAVHHGLRVRRARQLRERHYGVFEGLLYSEAEARYPQHYADWKARVIDAAPPEGERYGDFHARCIAAIFAASAAHPGQTLVIVAHGGVLECAYRAATGLPLDSPRSFTIPNAALNRFQVDGGRLQLDVWGDASHLRSSALDEIS
ncbi:histidine phosphatase family protein [Massilia sp. TS11]|uniref:histidine phosphatase family protein n=1 Tax=Massilia sp. TS11 TaxID=2908003 RepID=UPI001EDBC253|nr:histidine phosphatase family protein [Massilia sp. TS11]MCG2585429.1 histidine phosphatase family protein [Massilia sp. TS11]